MLEVCKGWGEGTFAGASGNDEDAPVSDLPALAPERSGSTQTGPSAWRMRIGRPPWGYPISPITLQCPEAAEPWSLSSLREKLIKIGAKVVRFPSGEGRLAPEYCLGLVVKHQCKRRCLHRC